MEKGQYKKLSYEDKFDRKYACWTYNHKGWLKCKTANRRTARTSMMLIKWPSDGFFNPFCYMGL